jgi:hypothetical protein
LRPASSLFHVATQLASAPLRGLSAVTETGRGFERRARTALAAEAERTSLAAIDAILNRVLDADVVDRVLERAEAAGVAQRVADRILEGGIAEQIAERAFSGPELERMLAAAFASALPEEVIAQLLASEALWILVDEIARSPSVTEAIAHQGTGFFEQVAARAREHSRQADTRVQRIAHRLRPRGERADDGRDELPLVTPASSGDAP